MLFIVLLLTNMAHSSSCHDILNNKEKIQIVSLKEKPKKSGHLSDFIFSHDNKNYTLHNGDSSCPTDFITELSYKNSKSDGEFSLLSQVPFVFNNKLFIGLSPKHLDLGKIEFIGEVQNNELEIQCSLKQKIIKITAKVHGKNKKLCDSIWKNNSKISLDDISVDFFQNKRKSFLVKEDVSNSSGCGCFRHELSVDGTLSSKNMKTFESLNNSDCNNFLNQHFYKVMDSKPYLVVSNELKEGSLVDRNLSIQDSVIYSWKQDTLIKECSLSYETEIVVVPY